MITKEKAAVYNIVETPRTEIDLEGGACIYSALALYRDGELVISRFVYDIARSEKDALRLLRELERLNPSADELCDTIAELL